MSQIIKTEKEYCERCLEDGFKTEMQDLDGISTYCPECGEINDKFPYGQ